MTALQKNDSQVNSSEDQALEAFRKALLGQSPEKQAKFFGMIVGRQANMKLFAGLKRIAELKSEIEQCKKEGDRDGIKEKGEQLFTAASTLYKDLVSALQYCKNGLKALGLASDTPHFDTIAFHLLTASADSGSTNQETPQEIHSRLLFLEQTWKYLMTRAKRDSTPLFTPLVNELKGGFGVELEKTRSEVLAKKAEPASAAVTGTRGEVEKTLEKKPTEDEKDQQIGALTAQLRAVELSLETVRSEVEQEFKNTVKELKAEYSKLQDDNIKLGITLDRNINSEKNANKKVLELEELLRQAISRKEDAVKHIRFIESQNDDLRKNIENTRSGLQRLETHIKEQNERTKNALESAQQLVDKETKKNEVLEKRIAELEQQLTLRKIQTESTEQSQEERSEPEEPQIEPIVILDNDAQTPSTEESEKPEMDFDTAQKTLKENLEASLESNDDRLFISDGKVAEAAEVYYKTIRRGSNAKYLPLEVQVPGEEDQLMWHQRTYDLEKNTSSGRWEILLRWNNGEFTGLSKPTLLRNRQDYLEAFDYIQQNIREEDVVTELGIITDPHLLNALEVIAPEPKYHLIVSKQSGAEAGTKDELVIVWKRSPEDDEDRVLTIDVDHLSAQNSDDPYRTEQSSIPLKTIKLEGALKKRVNEQRSQIKLQRINILLPNIECSTYLGLAMREFGIKEPDYREADLASDQWDLRKHDVTASKCLGDYKVTSDVSLHVTCRFTLTPKKKNGVQAFPLVKEKTPEYEMVYDIGRDRWDFFVPNMEWSDTAGKTPESLDREDEDLPTQDQAAEMEETAQAKKREDIFD